MSYHRETEVFVRRKGATELLKEQNPHPYAVPKSDIYDLVGSLSVHDLGRIAARFQRVADLTSAALKESRDHLEPADLTLIKRIAREWNRKHYRRIMAAIITCVGQGPQGISAALLTVNLAVQLTFRWSPEYRIALDSYRHRLSRVDHSSPGVASRGSRLAPVERSSDEDGPRPNPMKVA